MTLALSGDLPLSRALSSKFATVWLGPWSRIEAGKCPDLAAFMAVCRTEGFEPHVQLFGVGDQGVEAFWDGTVTTSRGMTLGRWWDLVKAIGSTLGAMPALVTLEPEWWKATISDGAPKFDSAWSDAAMTIRGLAPNAKIVNCPGEWAPGVQVRTRFPKMVAATDIWASQNLRCLTRHTEAEYAGGPKALLARLQDYAVTFPGKRLIVSDLCYSTYGGAFSKTHPFLGGNPSAADGLQAAAFQALVALKPDLERLGVTDIILRSLRDVDMDEWGNYFGAGEDCWGLERRDGAQKPARASLTAFAGPTPLMAAQAALTASQTALAASQANAAAWKARIQAIRDALA